MIEPGTLLLLVSPKGKRYLHLYEPGAEVHTHDGRILLDDVAAAGLGRAVKSHLGRSYLALKPTLGDLVKGVKRQTQIMYPKEIGYALLRLGVGPGAKVVESGTGSGGMTTALAWSVGDTGRVYTHERREEFHKLAQKNLARFGLDHRVEFIHADIGEQGFATTDADCLFLDVRTPWDYLDNIPAAVLPGAMCGFLLPTTNQVSELLRGLEDGPFKGVEVLEILVRRYKPVADRLRPDDRMVAHTGFLIFARCMGQEAPHSIAEDSRADMPEAAPGDDEAEPPAPDGADEAQ